jgi:hypothetical protein
MGMRKRKERGSVSRAPAEFTVEREAMLRLKGWYVCPICSTDEKKHRHKIGAGGSRDCLNRASREIAELRNHGVWLEPKPHYVEMNMFITSNCNRILRSDRYDKIESNDPIALLRDKILHILKENRRMVYRVDYWEHPLEKFTELMDSADSVLSNLSELESELAAEVAREQVPGGKLWKERGDKFNIHDPELIKILPQIDRMNQNISSFGLYYLGPRDMLIQKDGYVTKALIFNQGKKSSETFVVGVDVFERIPDRKVRRVTTRFKRLGFKNGS